MRIVKRDNLPTSRGRGSPGLSGQEKRAREAAIENELRRYIELNCGHYTTIESDFTYSAWRPRTKPYKYWCENCGRWRYGKKKKERPPLPDEPLF